MRTRAAAVALCLAACGSGTGGLAAQARQAADARAKQAREVAAKAGLAKDVQQVMGRAAGAIGRTFTVTYTSPDGGTVTVVQQPPFQRIEVTKADGSAEVNITNAAGTFRCEHSAGAAYSCAAAAPDPDRVGGFTAAAVESAIGTLSSSVKTYDFRVEFRQIAGAKASCLVTTRKADAPPDPNAGAKGVLCVSGEGVPLAVETDKTVLSASAYATGIPKDAFTLPA